MTNKYEKLDQLILNKIGGQPIPFREIYVRDVMEESERLATDENKQEPFRILDRRLQALRKKGIIKSITGKGWVKL